MSVGSKKFYHQFYQLRCFVLVNAPAEFDLQCKQTAFHLFLIIACESALHFGPSFLPYSLYLYPQGSFCLVSSLSCSAGGMWLWSSCVDLPQCTSQSSRGRNWTHPTFAGKVYRLLALALSLGTNLETFYLFAVWTMDDFGFLRSRIFSLGLCSKSWTQNELRPKTRTSESYSHQPEFSCRGLKFLGPRKARNHIS